MDDGQRRRARALRISRSVHRTTGALLFVFFLVVACTGLLLGWKKDTGGVILARTYQGSSTGLKDWLPIQRDFGGTHVKKIIFHVAATPRA